MKTELCKLTPIIGFNSVLKPYKILKLKSNFLAVIDMVCNDYGVLYESIKSERKTKQINETRQIAIYLLRRHTELSLKSIGSFFGNRHHSTIIHAIQTIDDLISVDKSLSIKVNRISNRINRYIHDHQSI